MTGTRGRRLLIRSASFRSRSMLEAEFRGPVGRRIGPGGRARGGGGRARHGRGGGGRDVGGGWGGGGGGRGGGGGGGRGRGRVAPVRAREMGQQPARRPGLAPAEPCRDRARRACGGGGAGASDV